MKNHHMRTSTQFFVGAVIIVLGILFLLDNLGIMDARYVIRLWPVLLIILGVLKIIQSRSSSSWIIGAILVFSGPFGPWTVWTSSILTCINGGPSC